MHEWLWPIRRGGEGLKVQRCELETKQLLSALKDEVVAKSDSPTEQHSIYYPFITSPTAFHLNLCRTPVDLNTPSRARQTSSPKPLTPFLNRLVRIPQMLLLTFSSTLPSLYRHHSHRFAHCSQRKGREASQGQ
jgi:hypothetical protein